MYTNLLVPTDGSDASAAAIDQALAIAEGVGATVHFLYVVDVGTEMSASGTGTIADELTETLSEEAERALDEAAARADEEGVAYERETLEGVPHEAIVDYSTTHDIDLISVGASGRSGIKEHLLGSTTDRVVRSSDTSVLVARPEGDSSN
ncbi:universal stress protein [Halegenticoccus soli]|uniref:universal stress protein n=1 Tax=Halegenticoccus soli TaxID=1985678 RepID=UPI000C6CBC9D